MKDKHALEACYWLRISHHVRLLEISCHILNSRFYIYALYSWNIPPIAMGKNPVEEKESKYWKIPIQLTRKMSVELLHHNSFFFIFVVQKGFFNIHTTESLNFNFFLPENNHR